MKPRKNVGHVSVVDLKILVAEQDFTSKKGIKEILRLVKNQKLDGVYFYSPLYMRRLKFHTLDELYQASLSPGLKMLQVTPSRWYDLRGETVFFFDSERLRKEHNRQTHDELVRREIVW